MEDADIMKSPILKRLTILPLVFALCVALSSPVEAGPIKQIEFKEIADGENLRLHIAYPGGHQMTDKRPAVVYFFGGGWRRGKPGQFYPFIQDLAKEGIVGISAQYRTDESHGATPVDCVMDGKAAIRYVREHAADLGIDPSKIIAGGGSAGGHVAACTAIAAAPEAAGANLAISSRPAALILLNPVLSVGPEGYAHGYVKRFAPDWRTISPLHAVDGYIPPTLILVGTEDKILPVAMTKTYKADMEAAGNRCDAVFYEGAGHGFFNQPSYREQVSGEIAKFLQSLGYLD